MFKLIRQHARVGGLHCVSQAAVKGAWPLSTPRGSFNHLTLPVKDATWIHATQGNSSQSHCSETTLAMLEPRLTNRSTSEGTGCLCPYPRGHRRKIVVNYYLDGLMVMAFSWMACVVTCSCGHRASSHSLNIQQHP